MIETTGLADAYGRWAEALEGFGDHLTAQTGDAIPALTAMIGTAYVAVNNGVISAELDPDEVGEAQRFLFTYRHIVDVCVAQLMTTGWLDIAVCESCDCGSVVPMPAYPVCEGCAGD